MIPRAFAPRMCLLLVVAWLAALCASVTADDLAVELIHPQGDDQGHFVLPTVGPRITVIGVVSPAAWVDSVVVNGKEAQLFEAQLAPFGADADTGAVEFRVTLPIKPNKKLRVRVHCVDESVVKMEMVPDTEATTARIRELVAEDADDVRMRCRLGSCLKDQGATAEAVEELRELLDEGDACISTRVTVGKALVAMGLPEEGMQEFRVATETAPDYAMAWLNLGLVHARFTRNTAEAVRCFEKYLALEPDSSIADKVKRYIDTMKEG